MKGSNEEKQRRRNIKKQWRETLHSIKKKLLPDQEKRKGKPFHFHLYD